MSTTTNGREAHSEEIVFELATRLLQGATIDVTDNVGRTWQATASTLSWNDGVTQTLVLDQANAFDVLTELAERLAAPPGPPAVG
ncbi:MAG: hypothetical protein BGO98_42220 [Myxococcales bacterium 68-20]|nr:hypothetical protein [Myxococcales bacterium]OJY27870.1 MAG: hypothetical protein BGO98_42220 [Myxococcales bacterium 68-20]